MTLTSHYFTNALTQFRLVFLQQLTESRIFDASYVRGAFGEEKGSVNISWTHDHDGTTWHDISDKGNGHRVVLKETVGPDYRILDPGGVVNTVPISSLTDYLVNYDNGTMFGNVEGILTTR